jgi:hypothetical protein
MLKNIFSFVTGVLDKYNRSQSHKHVTVIIYNHIAIDPVP